jgi:integrase
MKVNKPPPKSQEIPVLSPADQNKLYLYCMQAPDETCLGILLSLYAGLRIGEICALRWEDVDMERQTIRVRHTVSRVQAAQGTQLIIDRPKTPSSLRTIPIYSQLLPILRQFQADAGFVLTGTEDFVSPRTYEYRFHRVLKKGEIPDINYHGLRHSFATRCIEAGMDVKSLSEILGHADASITLNTYVHSSMEQKRLQMEKLAVP